MAKSLLIQPECLQKSCLNSLSVYNNPYSYSKCLAYLKYTVLYTMLIKFAINIILNGVYAGNEYPHVLIIKYRQYSFWFIVYPGIMCVYVTRLQ